MDKPIVWAIAGSDSGGGAGLQADLRTYHQLGVHGCTAVTTITAQNSQAVSGNFPVTPATLHSQLNSLNVDMPANAIKIGLLGSVELLPVLVAFLANYEGSVVLDPVLSASVGADFWAEHHLQQLIDHLLPHVDVLTPNLPEAERLLKRPLSTPADVVAAAEELSSWGPSTVIIKGGHGQQTLAQDYIHTPNFCFWLSNERLPQKHTHGTGCTFSSAMAATLALGYTVADAAVIAKMYTTQAIRHSYGVGQGRGPVNQLRWPEDIADLPWLTKTAESAFQRPTFPECNEPPLGLYPIVDSADWIARLLSLGVKTVQLRNKTQQGQALEDEIVQAITLGRQYKARVFINDYWQLGIKHGAYGIHLGQEDLDTADVTAIAQAGIRLGVSTHCYYEVARAHALQPSYIACGPIYATKIKVMKFAPQGLAALRRWQRTLSAYPIVAIGGINMERAPLVQATGVDSVSLIRAITHASDYKAATRTLLNIVEQP